jgi:hypothetical protein
MKTYNLLPSIACCLFLSTPGFSQDGQVTVLNVQAANAVQYHDDLTDPLKIATQPGVTPRANVVNFYRLIDVSDVVSVNGAPANGLIGFHGVGINSAPAPAPGQAIGDVARSALYQFNLDLVQADGTPIGTIVGMGLGGGVPPPGVPPGAGSLAIIGGTGAFLGAKGQFSYTGSGSRRASMAEDPASRRIDGGGASSWYIELIPMVRPQVTALPEGPAIYHGADFSLVTATSPARAGETLIINATGLGPVQGQTSLGGTFPADPLATVNSPVDVLVNGNRAEVINKVGWPGTTDRYRIDFRLPQSIGSGMTPIQLSVAWVMGPAVKIPVQ